MVSWGSAPAPQRVLVQKEWGGNGFAISCQTLDPAWCFRNSVSGDFQLTVSVC